MYREYLLNISDYFSLLSKKEASFEFIPPIIIGIIAFIYSFYGLSLYEVVVEIVHILEVLLGFLLAALALFVTINTEKVKLLKSTPLKILSKLKDKRRFTKHFREKSLS